jgi:hypothetical protein
MIVCSNLVEFIAGIVLSPEAVVAHDDESHYERSDQSSDAEVGNATLHLSLDFTQAGLCGDALCEVMGEVEEGCLADTAAGVLALEVGNDLLSSHLVFSCIVTRYVSEACRVD